MMFFASIDIDNQWQIKQRENKKNPLLTELAECFLKEYLQYFYDIFFIEHLN